MTGFVKVVILWALILATVKVANELAMTKAYNGQEKQQKRIADVLEGVRK